MTAVVRQEDRLGLNIHNIGNLVSIAAGHRDHQRTLKGTPNREQLSVSFQKSGLGNGETSQRVPNVRGQHPPDRK